MTRKVISGIYCIENIDNNKRYIGRAKDIGKRWNRHRNMLRNGKHENGYLQNSYSLHGEEKFIYYILQELEYDSKHLDLMEIYWIAYFNTFHLDGGGYNLNRGGGSAYGIKISDDGKRRISEARKGNTDWRGRKHRPESLKKISENNKGKHSAKHTNIVVSEKTRKKLSDANKGKIQTDEQKQLNSISHMGLMSRLGVKSNIDSVTSKYVGVSKFEDGYKSQIKFNKQLYYLGLYDTEVDAAIAYDKKAIELLGNKAKTNFPHDFSLATIVIKRNPKRNKLKQ